MTKWKVWRACGTPRKKSVRTTDVLAEIRKQGTEVFLEYPSVYFVAYGTRYRMVVNSYFILALTH